MFGLGGSFGSTKTPITAVELEWVDGLNGRIGNLTLSGVQTLGHCFSSLTIKSKLDLTTLILIILSPVAFSASYNGWDQDN